MIFSIKTARYGPNIKFDWTEFLISQNEAIFPRLTRMGWGGCVHDIHEGMRQVACGFLDTAI